MGWTSILGLVGSLLGKNKQAGTPPLQTPQLGQQGVAASPLRQAQPGGGAVGSGFGMLSACAGPNPPTWCPKSGTPAASPTGTSPVGSSDLVGQPAPSFS